MANTISLWDKTSNLTNQMGETITPEMARQRYGVAASAVNVMIETNPNGILIAIDDLETWVTICGIDDTLTSEEKLAAVIEHRNAPPPVVGDAITPDEIDEILNGGA